MTDLAEEVFEVFKKHYPEIDDKNTAEFADALVSILGSFLISTSSNRHDRDRGLGWVIRTVSLMLNEYDAEQEAGPKQ